MAADAVHLILTEITHLLMGFDPNENFSGKLDYTKDSTGGTMSVQLKDGRVVFVQVTVDGSRNS